MAIQVRHAAGQMPGVEGVGLRIRCPEEASRSALGDFRLWYPM